MKRIPLFSLVSAAAFFLGASIQVGVDCRHLPRNGDTLRPGVGNSRYALLSVDESSKTVLLDPTAFSYGGAMNASVHINGDTVSYVQFATRHRFLLRGDTLSYLDFENRATDFHTDAPVATAFLSLRDGERVGDTWVGYVREWDSLLLKNMKGVSTSRVDRGWAITDGTDTVMDVTRLIWNLDMEYADPDIVTAAMPDISTREIGRDSTLRVMENTYTFTNQLLTSLISEEGGVTMFTSNVYDPASDLLAATDVTVDGTTSRVAALTYDDLGRITSLSRGPVNPAFGSVSYTYNLHGKASSISGPGFSQTLHYADGPGTWTYDGTVSAMSWKMGGKATKRGYRYAYNKYGWLESAIYGEGGALTENRDKYTEKITSFDCNGSITGLLRYGRMADGSYGKVDDLRISYDGNRMTGVSESAAPVTQKGSMDYPDAAGETSAMGYNACGAMVSDEARGISSISYDNLGNPIAISCGNGDGSRFVYSAEGVKLQAMHVSDLSSFLRIRERPVLPPAEEVNDQCDLRTNIQFDYRGPFVYRDGYPDKAIFPGGYVSLRDSVVFHYYTTDYLGNVRAVVNGSTGAVEQTIAYYPYGSIIADISTACSIQPYKFGGKELVTANGLNEYDFEARRYYPAVPTFTSPDPCSEKYCWLSPYVYCANDPVNIVDPDGRDWYQDKETSYYTWFEGERKREGFKHIGGAGSLLGEFEPKISNILKDVYNMPKGLYSEGHTVDITNPNKGAIIPSKFSKMDNFLDEFIFGYGPEISIMTERHPYTRAMKTSDKVIKGQQKLRSGKTDKPGQITNVSNKWNFWDVISTPSVAKQFVGSFTFDSYISKDKNHFLNIIYDTKNFRSLFYHIPGTGYLNHSRNGFMKPCSTTYQFYIWKSKK